MDINEYYKYIRYLYSKNLKLFYLSVIGLDRDLVIRILNNG
jgi:hypothetical protein